MQGGAHLLQQPTSPACSPAVNISIFVFGFSSACAMLHCVSDPTPLLTS